MVADGVQQLNEDFTDAFVIDEFHKFVKDFVVCALNVLVDFLWLVLDHHLENTAEVAAKSWVQRVSVFVLGRLHVKESEESSDKLVVLFPSIFLFFFDNFD